MRSLRLFTQASAKEPLAGIGPDVFATKAELKLRLGSGMFLIGAAAAIALMLLAPAQGTLPSVGAIVAGYGVYFILRGAEALRDQVKVSRQIIRQSGSHRANGQLDRLESNRLGDRVGALNALAAGARTPPPPDEPAVPGPAGAM